MPLPTIIPAGNPEEEPTNGPKRQPFIPPRAERPAAPGGLSVNPARKPSHDDEEAAIMAELQGADRSAGHYVAADNATTHRSISADDAIRNRYDVHYKHLEELVVNTKSWLQGILQERELTQEVAIARANRNSDQYNEIRSKLSDLLFRHFANNRLAESGEVPVVTDLVLNEIMGLGPIEPLWQDPRITEIMINGPHKVRIEIAGQLQLARGVQFRDREHLLEVCQQILAPLNKTLDMSHPLEDGRLADGSRVNLTHYSVSPKGPYVTIRRFPEEAMTLRKLVYEYSAMSPEMGELLGNLVHAKVSTLISGGTGTGKTSALNALSGCISLGERIVTIEDTLELQLHPDRDVLAMESRQGRNDAGEVTIRDLVKNSLRQRPDRIIVGEVRDASAYDMLQAMNTGHEGSMTTIHTNNPFAAIERLSGLVSMAASDMNENQSLSLIANSLDLIIQLSRYEDGSRRVAAIAEVPSRVDSQDGRLSLRPRILWEFKPTGYVEVVDAEGNVKKKIVGEYVKGGPNQDQELSEEFKERHHLDQREWFSLEQLMAMSDLADS